jgi:hypothetical protein
VFLCCVYYGEESDYKVSFAKEHKENPFHRYVYRTEKKKNIN